MFQRSETDIIEENDLDWFGLRFCEEYEEEEGGGDDMGNTVDEGGGDAMENTVDEGGTSSLEKTEMGTDEMKDTNQFSKYDLNENPLLLSRDGMVGHVFQSLDMAEEFIHEYARFIGFSLRKSIMRKNTTGDVRQRQWVCSREGWRSEMHVGRLDRTREPKPISRVGCKVCFRVNLVKGSTHWICKEFIPIHSHNIVADNHKQFLRSNRVMTQGTLTTAQIMKESGIRTCHIMSYMAKKMGGYEKIPFTPKDLYNRISHASKVEFIGSNAGRAIGYLEHKADEDPGFFGQFSYNEDNRLLNLFWEDGRCRSDYETYGHVVAFDSTYKTNSYGKPLLIWIGINNHYTTCILGFAILDNESASSYKWATRAFLECMGGVLPKTVVTDGDEAIANTLQELMPDVPHRLCYWHLHNKAVLKVKDPSFASRFTKLVFRYYTKDEFEDKWCDLVKDFGIQGTEYVAKLYADKEKWAETFLRGNFFCGMTTTQRSEGINAVLKKKVNQKLKLYEFVRAVNMTLSIIRQREAKDEYITLHTSPQLGKTNLPQIEDELANLYTRNMFYKVRHQMLKEGRYMVKTLLEEEDAIILKLHKYAAEQVKRHVYVTPERVLFVCECQYFLSYGIPCRHIFSSIKRLHITSMPRALILSRWMVETKQTHNFQVGNMDATLDKREVESARFGAISSQLGELAYLGSRNQSTYHIAKSEIDRLCGKLKAVVDMGDKEISHNLPLHREFQFPVLDPYFTKSKGTAKKDHRIGESDEYEDAEEDDQCYGMGLNDEWAGQNSMDYTQHENETENDVVDDLGNELHNDKVNKVGTQVEEGNNWWQSPF
ncbi:protein FAR1-RELATED SEQUENCE 5-like [Humulus lupulus]|uniref:protein FAR1-RELATED SEQUENCE 5-like n=1 Tax=Humulus lupulus TaxID=3486 RepID=UPI002B410CA2|nr:protein FAR1-RELATED SEQUENCE 5-like [Humulus lupulus]